MSKDYTQLIEKLNEVLSWELAGIVQNMNNASMITGVARAEFVGMFNANSRENHDHAQELSERIAALGGIPTVEAAKITQATSLEDMLEAALTLEINAMKAWQAALEASDVAPEGIAFWLEDMISEEQEHIDEFRMLTGKVEFSAKALDKQSKAG